jgi:ribosomal protein L37AE/L43A
MNMDDNVDINLFNTIKKMNNPTISEIQNYLEINNNFPDYLKQYIGDTGEQCRRQVLYKLNKNFSYDDFIHEFNLCFPVKMFEMNPYDRAGIKVFSIFNKRAFERSRKTNDFLKGYNEQLRKYIKELKFVSDDELSRYNPYVTQPIIRQMIQLALNKKQCPTCPTCQTEEDNKEKKGICSIQ